MEENTMPVEGETPVVDVADAPMSDDTASEEEKAEEVAAPAEAEESAPVTE